MAYSEISISNSLSKNSVLENSDMSSAYFDDLKNREIHAISNEMIRNGDPILETYEVTSDAISGGMGSVWRVHHNGWDTDLAMKRPQPRFFAEGGEDKKKQFVKECENWIRLGLHPNIVSCYYVREIGGVPSVFSEWMDGGSLKDRIQDGSLYKGTEKEIQERILDIAIQTARGLHYSHDSGLIHQDVKPGNILMTAVWEAKVADFGLASAKTKLGPESDTVGTTGYTIAYCPAEQVNREEPGRWMDVYAWALTILEIYAGKRLWAAGAEAKQSYYKYPPQCAHPIPEAMQAVLEDCLVNKVDGFADVESRLIGLYRDVTGKEYHRPEPKTAENVASSLNNMALSYLDLGNSGKAEKCWNEAVRQNAAHTESLYNLALFRWRRTDIDDVEALNYLDPCEKNAAFERLISKLELERGNPEGVRDGAEESDITYAEALPGLNQSSIRLEHRYDSIQVSPDGKKLLMIQSSEKNQVGFDIYNYPEDKPCKTFCTRGLPFGYYTGLAMDWDRKRFAFLREKKIEGKSVFHICIYDLNSLETIRELPVDSACGAPHLFSPDGTRIYTKNLTAVDANSGKVLGKIPNAASSYPINDILISRDGKKLAVCRNTTVGSIGSSYDFLCLYDALTLAPLHMIEGEKIYTNDIRTDFSRDGSKMYVHFDDYRISVMNTFTGEITPLWKRPGVLSKTPGDVSLNDDGSLLAACFLEVLRLIETNTGRCLRSIPMTGTYGAIDHVVFLEDKLYLCRGDALSTFSVPVFGYHANWALSKIERVEQRLEQDSLFLRRLEAAQEAFQCGEYEDALTKLETARRTEGMYNDPRALQLNREIGKFCRRVALESVSLEKKIETYSTKFCQKLVFSGDGKRILSVCSMKAVLLDTDSGKVLHSFYPKDDTGPGEKETAFFSGTLNSDGSVACLTGGYLFDTSAGQKLGRLNGHDSRICYAHFSPDDSLIVTVEENRKLFVNRVRDAHKNKEYPLVCEFESGGSDARFLPDGDTLLISESKPVLAVFSISQNKVVRRFRKGIGLDPDRERFGYRDIEISADGKTALVHGTGYFILDLETGEILRTDQRRKCDHAVFTGFEQQIVSLSGEKKMIVVPALDSEPEHEIVEDYRNSRAVAVSPDMRYAAVGQGFTDALYLYRLNWKYQMKKPEQPDEATEKRKRGFFSRLFGK